MSGQLEPETITGLVFSKKSTPVTRANGNRFEMWFIFLYYRVASGIAIKRQVIKLKNDHETRAGMISFP